MFNFALVEISEKPELSFIEAVIETVNQAGVKRENKSAIAVALRLHNKGNYEYRW